MNPSIDPAAAKGAAGAPVVDISVGSRFYAFDLARELLSRGMLRHLHTGYPSIAAGRFGLPRKPFRSVWSHEPINRALSFLWRKGFITRCFDAPLSARFDSIVSRRLRPGADLFVGFSSQSLRSLQVARRLGMVTILEGDRRTSNGSVRSCRKRRKRRVYPWKSPP